MNFNDLATGVDIEEISRFEKYAFDKKSSFFKHIFTESELEYCFSTKLPAQHIAVRFCAKEAVYKALCGLGINDILMREIEVYHNEYKVPQIRILDAKCADINFKLSLSHNGNSAIAFVIAASSKR